MNTYDWPEGRRILTFVVGHKYCTVLSAYQHAQTVLQAVLDWADEVSPDELKTPFVIMSDTYCSEDVWDVYIANELAQVVLE